jgi:hypothetical protein
MTGMRLDHLSYACGPDGCQATLERLSTLLGAEFVDGGVHPRFGTVNHILPLENGRYIEVVDVLDHPASDKAPFGQAVRARKELGGGWLGWVVAVPDMSLMEKRLGRHAVPGNRHRPDGVNLTWRQLGVKGLIADPQLPFFVQWHQAHRPRDRRRPRPRHRLDRPPRRPPPRRPRRRLGRPQRPTRPERRPLHHPQRNRPSLASVRLTRAAARSRRTAASSWKSEGHSGSPRVAWAVHGER